MSKNASVPKSFETARNLFFCELTDDERRLLQNTQSPEAILDDIRTEDHDHLDRSVFRKCLTTLEPAVEGFLRFGVAIDVLCNVKPEVLCFLWGGLRIVLRIAKSATDFFENIVQCIRTIGVSLERIKVLEETFPNSVALRVALEELYVEVLEFCLDVKKFFADSDAKKKRHLIPKRLRATIQALWSSFSAQFEQTKDDMDQILDRIDKEANAAGLAEAKANRIQQDQWWDKHIVELGEASKHRGDERVEMQRQQRERQEQQNWRKEELSRWQEQLKSSRVMTNFISEETRTQVYQWLTPIDMDLNHGSATKLQHPGTCEWVFSSTGFKEWMRETNSLLWLHAIPGAGKTVLASKVVENLRLTLKQDEALVYYYLDYKDPEQQSSRKLLASLVASIALHYAAFLEVIKPRIQSARLSGKRPTTTLLIDFLIEASKIFSKLYIVVDALDECSDCDSLSDILSLPKLSQGDIKLFATSRKYIDIQEIFDTIPHIEIDMKESLVQPDIEKFVQAEVTEIVQSQRLKLRDPSLCREIIAVLSQRAGGMFQWVKCQLDQIRKLKTDKAIRASLQKLPKGLDQTYLRILEQIQAQNDDDEILQYQRLLRWLVHSTRPLGVQELAEAIAVDLGQTKFDESAVLTEPLDLFKYGESLIILKAGPQSYVQLSHFSVKEFLLSDIVRREAPSFYMGTLQANADIAEVCLTYLCFEDFETDPKLPSRQDLHYNLLDYARSEWIEHYKRAGDFEHRPKVLVSKLLQMNPTTQNFHNLCTSAHEDGIISLPIHYCAANGLLEQLKLLLDENCDLETDGDPYGSPLNFAVRFDQIEIVRYLVDRGASPNLTKIMSSALVGNNALHWALDEYHVSVVSLELIEVLLDSKIDVNAVGGLRFPQMAHHYAARAGRLDILKLLVDSGADIDAEDFEGNSALAIAIEEGAIDMASYLVDRGVSLYKSDGTHCDSIRESSFGSDSMAPGMSSAVWDVLAAFKSRSEGASSSGHWGFALGAAAKDGNLGSLQHLLNLNINYKNFEQRSQEQRRAQPPEFERQDQESKLSNIELEGRLGTMFSALTPALFSAHLDVVGALLNRMLAVLESLQADASNNLELEIHQMLIHDREDSKFCKINWDQSVTFMAVLIGCLRNAKKMVDRNMEPIPLSTLSNTQVMETHQNHTKLQVLQLGWPSRLAKVIIGFHNGNNGKDRDRSTQDDRDLQVTLDLCRTHEIFSLSKLKESCEQARLFWHAKRNPRKALHSYIGKVQPPVCWEELFDFMLDNGCNVNSLDRAGRTPLYWAQAFNVEEVSSTLLRHGGRLFAPIEDSFARLRSSILRTLHEIEANQEAFHVTSVDLSRKSDWNILGRYLYFAGDLENARRAFETGTVFDPKSTSDVPVYHYFLCDECNPGDYREETLIRGLRYVVRDSLDSDLCESCYTKLGHECLSVPRQQWIESQKKFHAEMSAAFQSIDTQDDPHAVERAKAAYRREALMTIRADILEWVRGAKNEWEADDDAILVASYCSVGTAGKHEDKIQHRKTGSALLDGGDLHTDRAVGILNKNYDETKSSTSSESQGNKICGCEALAPKNCSQETSPHEPQVPDAQAQDSSAMELPCVTQ